MALIEKLNTIGEAIRAKTGKTDLLTLAEMPDEIASIETGNVSIKGKQKITVIDYDGTILEETYIAEGNIYTLPDPPTQSGLTFQKWACPIEVVNNQIIVEDYPVTIAPIYCAAYTTITVELTKATGLTVNLQNITTGYLTWGDGRSDGGGTSFSHTYSNYGTYTIQIVGGGTTFGEYVFGQTSSAHNFYVKSINLASNVTSIGNYAFRYCESLETLTIPNTVTSINDYAFDHCYKLENVVIPSVESIGQYAFANSLGGLKRVVIDYGITSLNDYVFNVNYSLKEVIIPDTVTTLGSGIVSQDYSLDLLKFPKNFAAMPRLSPIGSNVYSVKRIILKDSTVTQLQSTFASNCYALESFEIPSTVTTILFSAFSNCYSLKELNVPAGVTTIPNNFVSGCYALEKINFSTHTSVPDLSNTNAFSGISKQAKIIVPDTLYGDWVTEANWDTYANYIYKASEVL